MAAERQNYQAGGVRWQVLRFDLLDVLLGGLTPAELPRLHAALAGHARPWELLRRYAGIVRRIPEAGENPDDRRVWPPTEIALAYGITPTQFRAELDGVRGLWEAVKRPPPDSAAAAAAKARAKQAEAFTGELSLADEVPALLERHGFPASWFDLPARTDSHNHAERLWFAGRVKSLAKLLEQKSTAEIARRLLLLELALRRREDVQFGLADVPLLTKEQHKSLQLFISQAAADEESLLKFTDQLREMAPAHFSAANELNVREALGTMIRGWQEFHDTGATRHLAALARLADALVQPELVDGLFDAEELQSLLRPCVQREEPQYRASLPLYFGMLRQNLWRRDWRPEFPTGMFKAVDAAFNAAYLALHKEAGLPVPNLLDEPTPAEPHRGEYAELVPAIPRDAKPAGGPAEGAA